MISCHINFLGHVSFLCCKSNWCLNFCSSCYREANHPSRCEVIQHSSDREHESQGGRFWICKAWSIGYWSNTHFYQSERDSGLPRSWIHEDLSTHPQEWCLLIWDFTYWDSVRPSSCGVEETSWTAGDTSMGKLIFHYLYLLLLFFFLGGGGVCQLMLPIK